MRPHRAASTSTATAGEADERVLSHGDAVLLRSDLAILRGPYFLNDRILAFYFSHLSDDVASDDLLLLPPSIPYLLSNLPDPASFASIAEPLRLASRRLALLPVNDNPDVSIPEGGSHWTLLVLDNTTEDASRPRFVHHDSLASANLPAARRLAAALRPLLPGAKVPLVEGPTPMQANCYDCGDYVMAVGRAICHWWKNRRGQLEEEGEGDWFEAVRREVDAESVKAMRGEVLQLISRLIQDKQQHKKEEAEEGNKEEGRMTKLGIRFDGCVCNGFGFGVIELGRTSAGRTNLV